MTELTKIIRVEWLLPIYAGINVLVFLMYAADKYKAKNKKWRIPERTLLFGAVLGIFGAVLGMVVMHHKTKKPKFLLGIPTIALIEAVLLCYWKLRFL